MSLRPYFNDWKITAKFKIESDTGLRTLDANYWIGRVVRVEFNSEGWIEGECKKFQVSKNNDNETIINFDLEVLRAEGDFTGRPGYLFRPDDVVKVEPVES
jgi:hypothetical protein